MKKKSRFNWKLPVAIGTAIIGKVLPPVVTIESIIMNQPPYVKASSELTPQDIDQIRKEEG